MRPRQTILSLPNLQHMQVKTAVHESVLDRIRNDDTRPLLAHDKENAIVELLESRKELYGAVTHKIDTSGRAFPPVQTAEEIIDLYQSMDS